MEEGRAKATAIELDIVASAPQPQATAMNSGTKPKRKRGDRKNNQYLDKACYVITEVGQAKEIRQSKHLRGRFRNAIGALVRDQLNPAIPSWKDVPAKKKGELWDKKLKLNFRFLECKHELVKLHAFKIMGESFRHWRLDLNKKYIQKGLTPFHEFDNIIPSQ